MLDSITSVTTVVNGHKIDPRVAIFCPSPTATGTKIFFFFFEERLVSIT
jgi:hypothetical protein